ncbi:MAG: hypothetical protein V7727_11040 [Sneathiella sp.]
MKETVPLEDRDILSIAETAVYFGKSIQTIYREIKAGNLPAKKLRGDGITTREGREEYLRNLPDMRAAS